MKCASYGVPDGTKLQTVLMEAGAFARSMEQYLESTLPRPVDVENLPEGEVVAVNKQGYALVGQLFIGDDDETICCESEESILEDVVLYTPIPEVIK